MQPLLEAKNISKSFSNVHALRDVDLTVFPRQVVGLVGENGAGKSTLMRVLSGIHRPDAGSILLHGREVRFESALEANRQGISIVFQEQSLLPNLNAYENLFLGHEKRFYRRGLLSTRAMIEEAREELGTLQLDLDPTDPVDRMSMVQREMLEITRNIWISRISGVEQPIIILDEPTSVLGSKDVALLFDRLRELGKRYSILFISHRLNEVLDLCDLIYVLKDGKNAGRFEKGEATEETLRAMMVGRTFEGEYYLTDRQRAAGPDVVLSLEHCTRKGAFHDVSFELHRGEILSICGTVGSGKEAVCDAIYGLVRIDSGTIRINGREARSNSPQKAFRKSVGFLPEDRRYKGLILSMPIYDNATLTILKGFVDRKLQIDQTRRMIDSLSIKASSSHALCRTLSGGNQQKVVFAKWILSSSRILVMSHPTRGVDVGAKQEIYALIRDLAQKGISIILIGDSFEEDIGLANRVVAMKDGRVEAILDATGSKPTPGELLQYLV